MSQKDPLSLKERQALKYVTFKPARPPLAGLVLSVALLCALPLIPPAAAQMVGASEPSFSCNTAKTPTEKLVCDDTSLSQRDAVMTRLYQALKKSGKAKKLVRRQLVWIKQRNLCRDDKECLEKKYAVRIGELARAAGDSLNISGTYRLKNAPLGEDPAPSSGSLWLAREPDGTLAGHIETASGPRAHSCVVSFRGALPLGGKWLWSAPPSELLSKAPCHILFEREKNPVSENTTPARTRKKKGKKKSKKAKGKTGKKGLTLKLSRTPGCNIYCGAAGEFAGRYRKQ